MTKFEQKLEEQFHSMYIATLNEPKYYYHLYADYVELVCLVTDGYVSQSDIIDRLIDEGAHFSPADRTPDGAFGLRETEITDAQESWIAIIFDLLMDRVSGFGCSYPFIVDATGINLIEGDKTNDQLLYIYLLVSSSLKNFKKVQAVLTSEFEILSEEVLKSFLPIKSIVKKFGSDSDYIGNAREKIKALATELNLDTDEYELNQISRHNSKEEGLDIIGWIPFEDKNPNSLIFLGQCGCGKDWFSKQIETSRYENFYRFYKQPPIHSLFIPFAISNKDCKFYQSKDIVHPTLVFERRRILEYSKHVVFDDSFLSSKVVEKCLEYREDIV